MVFSTYVVNLEIVSLRMIVCMKNPGKMNDGFKAIYISAPARKE